MIAEPLATPQRETEPPTQASVLAALDEVADPEIPAVSIVELGMIGEVDARPGRIRVELLPTFVGCPAIDLIRTSVENRLAGMADRVQVEVSFAVPWTSDRISPSGREKLRGSGFAPPPPVRAGRGLPMVELLPTGCPYCGSHRTTLESVFGPTQCRSIRHCADCRQSFESFKPV